MKTFLLWLPLLLSITVKADPIACLRAAEADKEIAPSTDIDARQRVLLVLCRQAKNKAPVTCYKAAMEDKKFPWPEGPPIHRDDSKMWERAVLAAHLCKGAENNAPLECVKTAQKDQLLTSAGHSQEWWSYAGYPALCGGAKSNAPISCLKRGLSYGVILQHKKFPQERFARLLDLCGPGFDTMDYPEKYAGPDGN